MSVYYKEKKDVCVCCSIQGSSEGPPSKAWLKQLLLVPGFSALAKISIILYKRNKDTVSINRFSTLLLQKTVQFTI